MVYPVLSFTRVPPWIMKALKGMLLLKFLKPFRCSLGYYGQPMQPGGQCQLCQCNNNSEICNTTSGVCQNCRNNTSGNQCERCRDGWYGDAILRTCQGRKILFSSFTLCDDFIVMVQDKVLQFLTMLMCPGLNSIVSLAKYEWFFKIAKRLLYNSY